MEDIDQKTYNLLTERNKLLSSSAEKLRASIVDLSRIVVANSYKESSVHFGASAEKVTQALAEMQKALELHNKHLGEQNGN